MLKIRKDNQFTWAWAITRDGQAIDLTTATNLKYKYQIKDQSGRVDILSYTKTGNIISTVFLPTQPGIYNLLLTFDLPADGPCAVDVDAFEIVKSSEDASDASEFTVTSEMAIGFTGKNAYEVWLDTHEGTEADYLAYLQSPATAAIASIQAVESTVSGNEALRVTAENTRKENETARLSAEALRVEAETARQTNTETAIQNAANATALAVEVAEHPDTIINDYWWKWNTTTNAYENTNIMAKGGVYYPVFRLDPETGILSITADSDFTNTTFEIDKKRGTLLLKINQ